MDTARHILQVKGQDVWSIAPDASVYDALRMMADKDVGSLLVMEDEHLLGMISEREYARQIVLQGKTSRDTKVREIMSTSFHTIHPDQTVEECMSIMTAQHVRYLPVIEDEHVIGVISIGDVVSNIIHRQRQTIKKLEGQMRSEPPAEPVGTGFSEHLAPLGDKK
jgi:CBS domain-containing protein